MKPLMTIRFWGVRGSIPSPGASNVRYGGNTSCVSIDPGTDKLLILDAGTGIRELGKTLIDSDHDLYILLSHSHWDHIQGFPFFAPIYRDGQKIFMFPVLYGEDILFSMIEQMDGANFPVKPKDLRSRIHCVIVDPISFLRGHGVDIAQIPTNHPGGGYGYRIARNGRSVVYLTDNELAPPYQRATDFDEFVRFCSSADLLIHDAQYLDKDMPYKHGWGHSLAGQVCELARAADVRHVVLFHHDPERTDSELDAVQEEARSWFKRHKPGIRCTVAYEGLEVKL